MKKEKRKMKTRRKIRYSEEFKKEIFRKEVHESKAEGRKKERKTKMEERE